jgi:hypothetical protein
MLMRKIAFVSFLLFVLAAIYTVPAAPAQVAVGITVGFAPPALPLYEQPVCPAPDYIWTPGYWAWDNNVTDYYWVPGTWVLAPEVGLLWTPPWWGWSGSAFVFHDGFWGPTIGFYGGIAYGFGYFGVGFDGGYWQGGHFFYNQSVVHVNVTEIHNVYTKTVVNSTTVSHVSYNGGEGGTTARPTAEEEAAARERHVPPTNEQAQHIQAARSNPELRASNNQGKPRIAATSRPGDFSGSRVTEAKSAGAPYHAPAGRPGAEEAAHGNPAVHAADLPHGRAPAPNTGDAKLDQKYQKQQDKLYAKQEKERQQLQKQQDQEHLQADRDKADQATRQQMEQKHQQQTQELQQRHVREQQALQARQTRRGPG